MANEGYSRLGQLGSVSIEKFLQDYWQSQHLFSHQVFKNFSASVSPEDLAGFSLEETIESRIIQYHKNKERWELTLGPIDENKYSTLPEKDWTLLVQNVDDLDPVVSQLLNAFRFIPNWRLGDIMVSYASDNGSVGPHFDYFDVFLLQAEGERKWMIGDFCDENTPVETSSSLKLLKHFEPRYEYIAKPGDLLYIPARQAHWGVSQGDCITYSIGFRAPSHSEILLDFAQESASYMDEHQRYKDASLNSKQHPGQLNKETIKAFKNIITSALNDETQFENWLGNFLSCKKSNIDESCLPLSEKIFKKNQAQLSAHCRSLYIEKDSLCSLHINGDSWPCSLALARDLSDYKTFDTSLYDSPYDIETLQELKTLGYLIGDWEPAE